MISYINLFLIIFIHFFADFYMQSHEMAINKSKSNYWLTIHITVYTSVTVLFWNFFLLQPNFDYHLNDYLILTSFIFVTHWITDYITSRFTSKLFAKGDAHNAFVIIGGDQCIHYAQLFFIYNYIVK